MKFGVVLFPSKKLQDVANSYRKRYDSHYSLIPPHLTLKEVFEATEDQIDEIAANLRKIAEETNPFTLNVTKVSSFSPANNVIYLKVEQKPELTSLYNKLHEGNLEQHLDVYSQLKLVDVAHEETVDRFHLMYQLENETWTVFETFRLGKG